MKAIVYDKYGGPEVLHLAEVNKPVPGDNEVLIKVMATSVNDWDYGKLDKSFFNRLLSGMRKPGTKILGSDVAGIVESTGKNAGRFKTGDPVYGDLSGKWGGFAEYVCAHEGKLELIPAGMSFEQAASIPQAATLAFQGLIDKGKIRKGQELLINGAGGGVGTFGIQLAKLFGVPVTAIDKGPKLGMLESLGAVRTIDYTLTDFTSLDYKFDIILDTKTNRSVLDYLRVLKPGGTYVTVGGSLSRLFQMFFLIPWLNLFSRKKLRIVVLKPNKYLAYINQLFVEGKILPVMDKPYSLHEVPEAFRYFENSMHKGKIVIKIGP